jgi:hypothetical protein
MMRTYTAFLGTSGNFPFRDKVTLDTCQRILTFQKRSLNIFGYTQKTIPFCYIVQVSLTHRAELLTFSRIDIVSIGGSVISVSGLRPSEAEELKELLDRR